MHMMMMQIHLDNERREQQNKNEGDQREREYQLRQRGIFIYRRQHSLIERLLKKSFLYWECFFVGIFFHIAHNEQDREGVGDARSVPGGKIVGDAVF